MVMALRPLLWDTLVRWILLYVILAWLCRWTCRTLGVSSRHLVCDARSGAPFRDAMMALAGVSDRSYGGIFSQLLSQFFELDELWPRRYLSRYGGMDLHGACYHSTSDVSGAVSAPPLLPFVVTSTNWLFADGLDGSVYRDPSLVWHCFGVSFGSFWTFSFLSSNSMNSEFVVFWLIRLMGSSLFWLVSILAVWIFVCFVQILPICMPYEFSHSCYRGSGSVPVAS